MKLRKIVEREEVEDEPLIARSYNIVKVEPLSFVVQDLELNHLTDENTPIGMPYSSNEPRGNTKYHWIKQDRLLKNVAEVSSIELVEVKESENVGQA